MADLPKNFESHLGYSIHIQANVPPCVYTGTATIPFIGIAVPLNLYDIMQQSLVWVQIAYDYAISL